MRTKTLGFLAGKTIKEVRVSTSDGCMDLELNFQFSDDTDCLIAITSRPTTECEVMFNWDREGAAKETIVSVRR